MNSLKMRSERITFETNAKAALIAFAATSLRLNIVRTGPRDVINLRLIRLLRETDSSDLFIPNVVATDTGVIL